MTAKLFASKRFAELIPSDHAEMSGILHRYLVIQTFPK